MRNRRWPVVALIAALLSVAALLGLLARPGWAAPQDANNDPPVVGTAHVLYDGSLGTLPGDQGMTYQALDGNNPFGSVEAVESYDGEGARVDTTPDMADRAGYFVVAPPLDRSSGYMVRFRAQVVVENHVSQHRAGFNIIAISSDGQRGIELAFWENEIWAQEGGTTNLFTHAEGGAYSTTAVTTYELRVYGEAYSLAAGGTEIVSGTLRDYTAFGGLFDPYETPNFLFFGDNTTAAEAEYRLLSAAIFTDAAPGPQTTVQGYGMPLPALAAWDVDAGGRDVALTLSVTHGTLAVAESVSGGLTAGQIGGNHSGRVVLTGSLGAINTTLLDSAPPTLTAAVGFSGVATMTALVNDLGHSGAGGAASSSKQWAVTVLRDPACAKNLALAWNGADAALSWDADSTSAGGYRVHRAADPYFVPGPGTQLSGLLPAGTTAYVDVGAPAPSFYLVRSFDCGDYATADTHRVGLFAFALRPGD